MNTQKQNELLDDLLKDCKTPEEILGKNGLLKQLTKKMVERALEGEMNEHLGYKKHQKKYQRRIVVMVQAKKQSKVIWES